MFVRYNTQGESNMKKSVQSVGVEKNMMEVPVMI
jgi:hypothetical protein